jgi:hypothetical protein
MAASEGYVYTNPERPLEAEIYFARAGERLPEL